MGNKVNNNMGKVYFEGGEVFGCCWSCRGIALLLLVLLRNCSATWCCCEIASEKGVFGAEVLCCRGIASETGVFDAEMLCVCGIASEKGVFDAESVPECKTGTGKCCF